MQAQFLNSIHPRSGRAEYEDPVAEILGDLVVYMSEKDGLLNVVHAAEAS